jgi:hypothetical protein
VPNLTAKVALDIWALRVSGGSLKNPLHASTGEGSGVDDEQSLADYVEETPGFGQARTVLYQIHAEHKPISRVWLQRPNERLVDAYARLRWIGLDHLRRDVAVATVYRQFLDRLDRRLVEKPWVKPEPLPEPRPVGEQENAELQESLRSMR